MFKSVLLITLIVGSLMVSDPDQKNKGELTQAVASCTILPSIHSILDLKIGIGCFIQRNSDTTTIEVFNYGKHRKLSCRLYSILNNSEGVLGTFIYENKLLNKTKSKRAIKLLHKNIYNNNMNSKTKCCYKKKTI